jgi:hypothetical protein
MKARQMKAEQRHRSGTRSFATSWNVDVSEALANDDGADNGVGDVTR